MKLQRYNIARTTVSELQNANLISPQEAAATQAVKFGAITSGLQSLGEMASAIAGVRAETEYNNAVSDLDDAVRAVHQDIKDMPNELNDQGNVKFDADKVIEMERGARESLISAIRENISSGTAKRQFDKHVTSLNMRLNEEAQVAAINREKETLKTNAELRRQKLLREGRHNDALLQAQQNVISGVLSPPEYNAARYEIKLDRDKDVLTRVLKNPEANDYEIEMMIDALKDGKFPDALGLAEPDMVLESEEILRWQGLMFSHANGMETRAAKQRKLAQQENTLVTLRSVLAGETSAQDVANLPLALVGMEGIKYLISQTRAIEDGFKSNQVEVSKIYDQILEMTIEGALAGEAESIKVLIRNNDQIIGKDQLDLFKAVDDAVGNISKQAPQRRILDTELVKLQGLTSLDTYAGTSDDRRSERIAGEQMKYEFWDYARGLGTDFTEEKAREWINNNKVRFYKIALSDSLAAKGIPMAGMPENREEAQKWIRSRLTVKLQDELNWGGRDRWSEKTDDEKSLLLQEEMISVELLLRHVWGE